jgi:outer membrane receptor for ferrienterochelin and colicins
MIRLAAAIGIVLMLVAPAEAQTARVSGTVVDASGAVVPGATVTLVGGGGRETTVSGPQGEYAFENVTGGTYEVIVSLVGFGQQTRDGIIVSGGAVQVPPVELSVARLGETVVVSASRTETALVDAAATMSVLSSNVLASTAAQNYGDLLRTVPGVNVVQLSARDVNVTSRSAASTLVNSQLTLLDGRSIYLDFFGIVLWDWLPNNMNDIKQIEVIRGPASAVWGANALTGVVNIVTKSPREAEAIDVSVSGGFFSRDAGSTEGEGVGGIFGANASLSRVLNDSWAFRVSAGYFNSEAYPRPTGTIPLIPDPRQEGATVGGARYPTDGEGPIGTAFKNRGTSQPKFDLRFDQEMANGGRMTYQGGIAGTDGIIYTGLGPFDIQSGSYMGYVKAGYSRRALRVNFFTNFVDADAPNLLLTDPATRAPLLLKFSSQSYDFEVGDSVPVGTRQVISVGGNIRRNNFNMTIAPDLENRTELGVYGQDEVILERVRLTLGARVDKFGNLSDPVFSPRLAGVFKLDANHSVRAAFNKAFRSPSVINNYLDASIIRLTDLRAIGQLVPALAPLVAAPFPLVVKGVGSRLPIGSTAQEELTEESLTAYELAYTGTLADRTTVGLAFYVNDLDNNINFTQLPTTADPYTAANPPPGWLLPPTILSVLAARGTFLPRTAFTYLNLGPIRQKGVELSVDHRVNQNVSLFANYSWQDDPTILDDANPYPPVELSLPPTSRFNAGFNFDGDRGLGSLLVSYSDEAFWSDVLTTEYHGFTDAYTTVNGSVGMKWHGGRITTLVKANNMFNKDIQQHVFGDLIKRSVTFEVRFRM